MNKQTFKKFSENSLKFLDKRLEDMNRNYKLPPKRESLLLYRDAIKMCKKFYWNNEQGKQWSEILLKTTRMEFEDNKNMNSIDVGRKLVLGRQSLIQLEEKVLKMQVDMNKHFQESKFKKN